MSLKKRFITLLTDLSDHARLGAPSLAGQTGNSTAALTGQRPDRPGSAFAKCLLNFGLRPDRPAGIRHREPMGDRPLRTVAHDVTQRRGAHCSLLGGYQGVDTVPCRCDFSDTRNSVISISLS